MSKETREWLSTQTLIGFTDKRGTAWHYRAGDGNHYSGPVPVGDVHRRLFDWTAEEHPLHVETGRNEYLHVPDRKAIVRSDTKDVLGIFTTGYRPHQYSEWLVHNVESILDDDLGIGSAGLLRGGAQAWVSVEVPDTITTPEGVTFRPNLLACTSFDGSLATTYKRVVTNTVCDNTMGAALREQSQTYKVAHTANSLGRLEVARDALGIVYSIADDFQKEVADLCKIDVDDKLWGEVLEVAAPVRRVDGKEPTKRAVALSERKRAELTQLWTSDPRVSPWQGTAYGVWQAVNTHRHHFGRKPQKGKTVAERNMERAVEGTIETEDAAVMGRVLSLV